ncbi:MAG: NADH-quinone oxidoreductase subunit N [Cytophagaceae bacterium]|nr:NADH-quinone oxidoreductase subunit N [Cytophagaceae bacterium]MBK9934884.1 NADH-quinone oxidoreductase subunit N [Cytophagaceae bacterium]MBL0301322.1 NADH-quinone oxidoreductase subunit N [Cytophagaceae bacterium]
MINKQLTDIFNDFGLILPELFLALGLFYILILVAFIKNSKSLIPFSSFLILIFYLIYSTSFYKNQNLPDGGRHLLGGMLLVDNVGLFFKQIITVSALIFFIHARLFRYKYSGEIFFLVISIVFGLSILVMSTHFMVIYLALEMVSIVSYVLVVSKKEKHNFEAGIKYLIFGSTSSAIMLFGISFFYGMSFSFDFGSEIFRLAVQSQSGLVIQALLFFVLGGFLFKIAAAPFHSWVPDVYESTSTPIISFLSFAPKAGGFLVISRLISAHFADFESLIIFLAAFSMIVGNLAALAQTDFKRLLGYSGIAHSGFVLVGMLLATQNHFYGSYFYILTYLVMTMGAFFLADLLNLYSGSQNVEDFRGLGQKNILLGINALILMAALVGLPPTLGFHSKLMVFSGIINPPAHSGWYYSLLIFGLLNAAISIYYYLKVPYFMLIKGSYSAKVTSNVIFLNIVLSFFSLAIIYLFFFPDDLTVWIKAISK